MSDRNSNTGTNINPRTNSAYYHSGPVNETVSHDLPDNLPPVIRRPEPQFSDRERYGADTGGRRPERSGPVRIDETRVFYVTGGPDAGGLRHDWKRWRYINADGQMVGVEVIYAESRSVNGTFTDSVELYGPDAFNFLKLVEDRNSSHFRRDRGLNA